MTSPEPTPDLRTLAAEALDLKMDRYLSDGHTIGDLADAVLAAVLPAHRAMVLGEVAKSLRAASQRHEDNAKRWPHGIGRAEERARAAALGDWAEEFEEQAATTPPARQDSPGATGQAGAVPERKGRDVTEPYYADDAVTLYHGDCREITEWLSADVLVTDPPYGRGWRQGWTRKNGKRCDDAHPGIVGDLDSTTRDEALRLWGGDRRAVVFGDLLIAVPAGTVQVGIFRKPVDTGTKGARAGFRRDVEGIYLVGPWPPELGGTSSVLASGTALHGTARGTAGRYGHPHAKPVDVMENLIGRCPSGAIADPFAGGGSTLIAARNLGRPAIGVEIEERYCELIARRLSQDVLPIGEAS